MGLEHDVTAGKAWGETTLTYSTHVATSSGLGGKQLVDMVQTLRKIDETSYVLDLGTGTGTLVFAIARSHPSTRILATDVSAGMIAHVSEHVTKLAVTSIEAKVLDAQDTHTLGRNVFSHIFSTFALQYLLKPDSVLSQAYDALEPGGVIGLGVWHKGLHTIEIWQQACRTIDPTFEVGTEHVDPNAWLLPDQVKQHLELARFTDVQVTDTWLPWKFASSEAFRGLFVNGKNPALEHLMRQWKGDRQQAIDAVGRVVKEKYGNGQDIKLHAILAVGRKA